MDSYRYWEVCANQDADELRTFFHKDATVLWHNTNECFTSNSSVQTVTIPEVGKAKSKEWMK